MVKTVGTIGEFLNNGIKLNATISSPYGAIDSIRNYQPHNGIDLPFEEGTELKSIVDGVVKTVFDDGGSACGKGAMIEQADGYTTIWCHLSEVSVKTGEKIKMGETIGLSGSTGNSSAPHLHFAVKDPSGEFIDPTGLADVVEYFATPNLYEEIVRLPSYKIIETVKQFFRDGQVDSYQQGPDLFWRWVGGNIADGAQWVWEWFVLNLPDIMGYGTILAGALIILGAAIPRVGIMKPASVYAMALIVALCILAGA